MSVQMLMQADTTLSFGQDCEAGIGATIFRNRADDDLAKSLFSPDRFRIIVDPTAEQTSVWAI